MTRLPRLAIPGLPYHVTQRGNRRSQTFFEEGDYALYRDLLAEAVVKAEAELWCYCLMPNHVHVIVVSSDEDGLRRTFAFAHRRYTGFINARHRWTRHLWQGRFGAVVKDEPHLAHAMRYVSLNPARARPPAMSSAPRTGAGQASVRMSRVMTMISSLSRRHSNAMATSRRSLVSQPMALLPGVRCGSQKHRAVQSAAPTGSPRSRNKRAACSRRRSAAQSRRPHKISAFSGVAP